MKKSELRRLIKEELLKEYVRDEPEISKSYDAKAEKEKKEIMNKWMTYKDQFGNIAYFLTNKSGYWYVGSGIDNIIKKLENLDPKKYQKVRDSVASLMKKSRVAEKSMNDVKVEASKLIKEIEK